VHRCEAGHWPRLQMGRLALTQMGRLALTPWPEGLTPSCHSLLAPAVSAGRNVITALLRPAIWAVLTAQHSTTHMYTGRHTHMNAYTKVQARIQTHVHIDLLLNARTHHQAHSMGPLYPEKQQQRAGF
jgi:hypothetical protein